MNLTPLDYAIIALPFLIVLLVNHLQRGSMKSVADFLAAGRCAGRYLLATSAGEAAAGVVLLVTALEMFQRTGFSLQFWGSIAGIITMLLPLIGLVVYRYRETRSLTFHQFFEARYSKGIRVYSSFINVFAGLFNFGIMGFLMVGGAAAAEHLAAGGLKGGDDIGPVASPALVVRLDHGSRFRAMPPVTPRASPGRIGQVDPGEAVPGKDRAALDNVL